MEPRRRTRPPGVALVRTGLPVALVGAAAVVLIVGPRGLAPGLLAAAIFVIVADWIIRIAFASQTDRDVEASARSRFARSGRWPEDDGAGPDGEAEDPDGDRGPARGDAAGASERRDSPHRSASRDGTSGGTAPSRRPSRRRPPRR